jgi:uncharacterized protein
MTMRTDASPDLEVASLAARLEEHIAALGPVLVAFSGGVDSSVVAVAAHRALGGRALAVTADTESNTDGDLDICRRIAEEHGLAHQILTYSELAIPNYAENPVNRCFFCKNALYEHLVPLAVRNGLAAVCDGSNSDDGGDYRPGMQAVARHGVRSPLRELGIGKADVRRLAVHYGLPNHDRPAAPCLSSRVPYGQPITREKLDQIAQAEAILRGMGLREFRCRHHGDVARIEARPDDFPLLLDRREELVKAFRKVGFHWVALDLAGFRSGSLNRVIAQADRLKSS